MLSYEISGGNVFFFFLCFFFSFLNNKCSGFLLFILFILVASCVTGLADRFEEYPKLRELIRLKDELISATNTPPM